MTDFYRYSAKNLQGEDIILTIASGPIVMDNNQRFLLHRSPSTGKYQFIGGRLDDAQSPQQNAVNRPMEDLGLEVTLDKTREPLLTEGEIERDGAAERIVLIHYFANIKEGAEPIKGEWKWFTLNEIEELDRSGELSSPNVLIACRHFMQ
jgi:8-oxo-dGTP pyrophosphatase MutT (NUDIX family)